MHTSCIQKNEEILVDLDNKYLKIVEDINYLGEIKDSKTQDA